MILNIFSTRRLLAHIISLTILPSRQDWLQKNIFNMIQNKINRYMIQIKLIGILTFVKWFDIVYAINRN